MNYNKNDEIACIEREIRDIKEKMLGLEPIELYSTIFKGGVVIREYNKPPSPEEMQRLENDLADLNLIRQDIINKISLGE